MSRKLCCLALIVVFLITVCGCADTSSQLPDNCKKVEPLKEYRVGSASYVFLTEEELIAPTELIFKGVVLEKSEYEVETPNSKKDPSRFLPWYAGIIKYRITEVIYSEDDSIQKGNEINILTSATSHRWTKESIDQEVDQEYIILADKTDTSKKNDPYNYFINVSQYYIFSSFRSIVVITDEGAEFHEAYTTLAQMAQPTKRITPYNSGYKYFVMNEQDFIAELEKLLELYKKPRETVTPIETTTVENTGMPTETITPLESVAPTEPTADATSSSDTSKPEETGSETTEPEISLEPTAISQ